MPKITSVEGGRVKGRGRGDVRGVTGFSGGSFRETADFDGA